MSSLIYNQNLQSNDQIFNILFNNDEITWQSMIYDLVSSEKMDPWDIDVSLLANKFLEKLKKLKEMDLKISGKVLLAAAIMLRVKSYRFLEEDISALDALIASANSNDEVPFEELVNYDNGAIDISSYNFNELNEKPALYPRTPQPRKRKVSVFDLVKALEKALEVYQRRPSKIINQPEVKAPEKPRDISIVIKEVYNKIITFFKKNNKEEKLKFHHLLNNESKEEKVFTFIPLLHLDFQRKVDLMQEFHFGDIEIKLVENK
ncbi:MAG: segregation/condensation protein A [Candidatus Woesearchaeota archaeon]